MQDGLIRIDAEGKADTLPELWGKYITAFYTPPGGTPLYVATLNDGVYSAHNGRCEPIPATQSLCFIRDLTLPNGYPPNLVALTNRRLVGLQSADTLAAKGCYRVVNIGDSLLYTFPEYGIYRYTFKDGHLQAAGVFFSDIRFHPNAVSVVGNRLYLGTAIGAMTFEAGRESAAEWIAFNSDVVSGKWVLMGGALVLIFLGLAVFIYRKQRQQYRRQIQVHIHDLSQRLAALVRMSALLTPEEDTEVKRLQSQLQQVPTGIGAANQFIQALSTQIMRRNQDLALQLSKLLARQIRQLESSEAFDAQHLLEASLQTQAADDVEAIGQQVLCNESWLHRMEALHTLLHQCRSLTQGVPVVEGVNEGLEAQCAHLQSGLAKCSLDLLAPDITALQQAYDSVHSEAARTALRHRLEATHQRAAEGVYFDKTTAAIAARVSRLMETLHETPPAVTLQVLYELELHLLQIDLLVQLRQNMLTYTRLRNEIVHENQQRIHHKFDAKLDAEIAERTQPITVHIDSLVTAFYRTFEQTDAFVLKELLHFTHYDGQQARVLALLLAHPKVKRLFLAGMLGIYGNLNPVMSRLINGKLKPNDAALAAYVATHPMSIVTYVRLLSE